MRKTVLVLAAAVLLGAPVGASLVDGAPVGNTPATVAAPAVPAAPAVELTVPDSAITQTPGVVAAAGSVLLVAACEAATCPPYTEIGSGSGWVVAPGRVVTNAHVVAGAHSVRVQVGLKGRSFPGRIVIFDPARDLAVLAVPGLPSKPLPLGGDLKAGDPAIIAGFPAFSPYMATPARVTDRLRITINDGRTEGRDTYRLAGYATPGNSGGPLLNPAGEVVGVVYAGTNNHTVVDALTLTEARPVLDAAATATTPVNTGTVAMGTTP